MLANAQRTHHFPYPSAQRQHRVVVKMIPVVVSYEQDIYFGDIFRFVDVRAGKWISKKERNRRCEMEHGIDENPNTSKLKDPKGLSPIPPLCLCLLGISSVTPTCISPLSGHDIPIIPPSPRRATPSCDPTQSGCALRFYDQTATDATAHLRKYARSRAYCKHRTCHRFPTASHVDA